MKEKFEHKITERIKEVFTSHQVEFNPQDWESLQDRLPAEKSHAHILFWSISRIAAVIILILTSIYFLWNKQITPGSDQESVSTIISDSIKEESQDPFTEISSESLENKKTDKNNLEEINFENQDQLSKKEELFETKTESQDNDNSLAEIILTVPDTFILTNVKSDTSVEIAAIEDTINKNQINSIPRQVANISERSDSLVYAQEFHEIQADISPLLKPKKQKVKIGAELATYTNYAPESITPSLNYGGGIATKIPIKGRFSFNPGLVISGYDIAFKESSNLLTPDEYTVFSTFGVDEVANENPEIKPVEAQLTGLDIPINFQYNFLKKKKGNYFLELGFSSLLYLSENYTYSITYIQHVEGSDPGTSYSYPETIIEQSSSAAFQTFDFAKLLNFSVGLDYHLSKKFDMVVNPYFKYPVNSISSADIKFGSGGLKLKFLFIPK